MTPGVTERVLGGLVRERSRFLEFARGRVGADAEDVLQIALTRAVLEVDGLRDETLARPWFFRILRNAIADHHARGALRDALLRLCATDSIRACVDCGCDAPTESV